MQPLDPRELAQRIAAERQQMKTKSKSDVNLTERRRQAEQDRDARNHGYGLEAL